MNTLRDVHVLIDRDVSAYREMRSALMRDLRTFEQVYRDARDISPLYAMLRTVDELGVKRSRILLASLTNHCAWDGRISRTNAKWAESVPESWDEDACQRMGLYTDAVHKAHLDQIVTAYRNAVQSGKLPALAREYDRPGE